MSEIWDRTLEGLKKRTNPQHFEVWFKPLTLKSNSNDRMTLMAPSRFMRDWLINNYLDVIQLEASKHAAKKINIRIEAAAPLSPASIQPPVLHRSVTKSKPKPKTMGRLGLELNPRFLFTNFVVGKTNDFAHAACKAVADRPGEIYNPLTIYGGPGLGKTHLLQAIGHAVQKQHKELRVAFVSSEKFTNELIAAIGAGAMADFRRKYRDSVDVLLVDDIQFIAGKNATQEEFFHTFNTLHQLGKQVVVTTDQYPQELKALDERVRSRLVSGLTADVKEPDLEMRSAILKKIATIDKIDVPDEVIAYLAENIRSNVRELEGALIRLRAISSFKGESITLAFAKQALGSFLEFSPATITPDRIMKKVATYFDVKVSALKSKSRARNVALPRQMAMYLMKEHTDLSLQQIGQQFGNRDHSTVIASVKKIERLMVDNKSIRDTVETVEKSLTA